MSDWSQGYQTDLGYTHGYYGELSPTRLAFGLLVAGYDIELAPDFTYLELGFGQGLSLNIHAASSDGTFYGIDLQPDHAHNAQSLARASGSGAHPLEASFSDLLARADLPQFDVITLHGVYSWVPDAQRREITEIAKRFLKTGGLLYVSYNAMPGWAAAKPVRDLMRFTLERQTPPGMGAAGSLQKSFETLEALQSLGALYFEHNPQEKERLKRISGKDKAYLVHEFLNEAWDPLWFKQVAENMAEAKLTFAAPAPILDQLDRFNLPSKVSEQLASIPDIIMRETQRDLFINQQFRRDIYVRGTRKLSLPEQQDRFAKHRIVLGPGALGLNLTFETFRGEQSLNKETVLPVLNELSKTGSAMTVGALFRRANPGGVKFQSFTSVILLLVAQNILMPARRQDDSDAVRQKAHRFNKTLIQRRPVPGETLILASPVAGAGIKISRLGAAILSAYLNEPGATLATVRKRLTTPENLQAILQAGQNEGLKTPKDAERVIERFFKRNIPFLKAHDVLDFGA